jgi:hypothetical protein
MRNGIRRILGYELLIVLIVTLLANAAGAQDVKIAVLNAAVLTSTTPDIGNVSNCFDGNPATLMRSADINPAFVQVAFSTQREVTKLRVLLGQPGYPNIDEDDWWLEAADTQEDLDRKTGSYQLVVPERFDVAGTWDEVTLSKGVSKRIWRFWIERTVGDNYVHIPELELWTSTSTPTPTGVDLDVTYISREPRYEWNSAKEWPDQGETVTFTAHIVNKGSMDSGPLAFEWLIDNKVVATGTAGNIPPQGETTKEFTWEWQPGRHYIGFRADPENLISEFTKGNNAIADATDALSIAFWVEESVYNEFNRRINGSGSYSWEDWAQRIIENMNSIFVKSTYPLAPQGVLTRVRLDKVTIVPDGTLFSLNAAHAPRETTSDGQWGFSVQEYQNCSDLCMDVPWWVIHELGHYLFGLVDLYGLDVQDHDVNVLDDNRNRVAGTPLMPHIVFDVVHYASRIYDLMHVPSPYTLYSDHTTYSLNRYWPMGQRTHPRFGAYIADIPRETKIRVLDGNEQPLVNVKVAVYQAVPGDGSSGPYSQNFDNIPDIVGSTDSNGLFSLGGSAFPNIYNIGILSGIVLVKLQHPVSGKIGYVWVEVLEFNMAYWRGETDLYIHDVHFPEGPNRLRLDQNQVIFSSAPESPGPSPKNIQVNILGEGVRYWRVSPSNVPWLKTIPTPSPDIGISHGAYPPGPLTFVVDSTDLAPGTYTTVVSISSGGDTLDSPQTVTVTLNVELENIDNYVTFNPIISTYTTTLDTMGCPAGFVGKFSFDATLRNISHKSLFNLMAQVKTLTNGNLLQNADGGPAGVGAIFTLRKVGNFSDGALGPGEFVDVPFTICLKQLARFSFFVDVLGMQTDNLSNSVSK